MRSTNECDVARSQISQRHVIIKVRVLFRALYVKKREKIRLNFVVQLTATAMRVREESQVVQTKTE